MYQLYVIEKETIIMEDIQSVVTIKELYSLDQTMAKPLLEKLTYPWEALPLIKDFVLELGKSLDKDEYNEVDEHVWIHKSCKVYTNPRNSCTKSEECIGSLHRMAK